MAVDANVLIFERIREELRLGKTARAAIEGGYSKALVTILDANVTTFIAALVLFQFGSGPVKGFAVTLSIGVVFSFVTAVFITRVLFDYLYVYNNWKRISI
jgi:preprotein translocase subunit SecD